MLVLWRGALNQLWPKLADWLIAHAAPAPPIDDQVLPRDRTSVDIAAALHAGVGVAQHAVMVAASGEEALTQLARHRFDLLLLDLKLPHISGLDVARHAQALQPAPAILLLTGHASLEAASGTPRLEAFEYMLKTSSPQDVLARVAAILQARARAPCNYSGDSKT